MTADLRCVICGRPLSDQAYACPVDALSLAETLQTAAGHAEDAETVLSRQARYGGGSRGGSSDGLTYDATKTAKYDRVRNTVGTWVDDIRGTLDEDIPAWRPLVGALCPPTGTSRCGHGSCDQLRHDHRPGELARDLLWLAGKTGWLRKRQEADQAFRELTDACEELARLVDRPPDKVLFGQCDCGKVLYAATDKIQVRCPVQTCRQVWHVERSREILRAALDSRLVTAQEAARLGQYLDSDRTQDNIRKLIDGRVKSGRLVAHGEVETEDGPEPTYRFGEISLMLATIPKRERRRSVQAA